MYVQQVTCYTFNNGRVCPLTHPHTHKQTHTNIRSKRRDRRKHVHDTIWILHLAPNHHFYLFIYLLNVFFLSLLASHLVFGNILLNEIAGMFSTIEHNRITQNGKRSRVLQTYKTRGLQQTINNSLSLLKSNMRQLNAHEGAVSYQHWQYVWLYFPQRRIRLWNTRFLWWIKKKRKEKKVKEKKKFLL